MNRLLPLLLSLLLPGIVAAQGVEVQTSTPVRVATVAEMQAIEARIQSIESMLSVLSEIETLKSDIVELRKIVEDLRNQPPPIDPEEPVEPGEPTDPVDPVDPTEPTDPTEPVEPVDPVDPVDPTDPEEPTEPTDPEEPVEPEPTAKKLIEVSDLQLVGGWRLQSNNATAFIQGGLAIDAERKRCWTDAGHKQGVIQYAMPPIGLGYDFNNYPIATIAARIHDTELWGTAVPNLFRSEGVCWHPASQRLFVSARSTYHTVTRDRDFWLASIDLNGRIERYKVDGLQQQLGGGVTVKPDGNLAFASGGYKSGQQSMLGPSLASFNPSSLPILNWHLRFDALNSTDKTRIEKRQPDYWHGASVGNPDGALMGLLEPDGDVGYWQADQIMGSGVWIETDTHKGVLYNVSQGTGELVYAYQTETFSAPPDTKTSLYVYDPSDFTKPGKFERWPLPEGMKSVKPNSPRRFAQRRGMVWDADSERLYVLYAQAWGGTTEAWPIVSVYKIGEGE